MPTAKCGKRNAARRSFTLTELLAAMAIIAIIAGVTAISIRTIARDAKLSSASNTIAAGLDTARGIAIRDNKLTVLVFRPRLDGNRRQYVELVTAQWTGESPAFIVPQISATSPRVVDRFVPVPGIAARRLPSGIKVGGPAFGSNNDDLWQTPSHFPSPGEFRGYLVGVMFAGNGTVVMRNAVSDSHRLYVDFNGDGIQQVGGAPASVQQIDYENPPPNLPSDDFNGFIFLHIDPSSEPFVSLVPYLAVFDDDRCRDEYDVSEWANGDTRIDDYTEYITNHADRIHFNRYTGVVMR